MSSQAEQPSLILTRRLADGTIEWIPLETPARVTAAPDAAYALIDRADYEAPETMVVQRQGEDLVVEVQGTDALVLEGFFSITNVAFYSTPDIAGGAGPFSGSPLTPDSSVPTRPVAAEQLASAADDGGADADEEGDAEEEELPDGSSAGGTSPMVWVGVGAGGLALAALAGGGGGGSSGGGSTGGGGSPGDTVAPEITSGDTADSIAENSGAGQVVYDANATDAGTVTWSLAGADAGDFSINPSDGQVTLTGNPNFESKPSYNFTVVATDAAGNSSQQPVTLAINDLDEDGPSVSSVALTGSTGAQNDTLNAGDTVTVTVTMSEDTVVSGTPQVELDIGNDTVSADYVTGSGTSSLTFRYTVQTSDNDNDGISIPADALQLNSGSLTDAAGNAANLNHSAVSNNASYLVDTTAPAITSGDIAPAIDENSGAGQVVYDANATDAGTVTWSLAGADAGDFSINPSDGQVTLTGNPNFESKPSYNFTVVATDAAGNSSQQPVTLAINDLDEDGPSVSSVALTGSTGAQNDTLNAGDTVTVTVTMSEDTVVSGTPQVELDIGNDTVSADYVTGSGTSSLTFRYTVQTSDNDNDGISIPADALQLNSGSLTDAAGNAANLNHSAVSNNASYLVDTTAPAITSGDIAPAIDENSGAGQVVYDANATDAGTVTWSLAGADAGDFSINPSDGQVTLTANPNFESKPSYNFTVVATDAAGNSSQQPVTLAINDLDEDGPSVSSVALTGSTGAQNDTLNAGDTVTVTVTMSEDTVVSGTPQVELDIGNDTVSADYVTGSGTSSLTFRYTVQTSDNDSDGISIPANALQLNGGSLTDAAGNAANLNHSAVSNNASYLVDTTAPAITSGDIAPAIDENSGAGQVVYDANATDAGTVTWSLAGADAGDFSINPSDGEVTLTANPNFESKPSYNFTVVATDAAGNSSQQPVTLAINDLDEDGPSVSSVALTGSTGAQNDTLNAGDTVTVTVTMSEDTVVSGTPQVELDIGNDTVSADYVTGSGTSSLTFRYTVQPGDNDSDGISIPANALQLNGGSLTDAAGNAASLNQSAVSDNASYLVDTTAPTVSSVALTSAIGAQNDTLNADDTVRVTVTMSENTVVDTTGGTPRIELNIDGSAVFADYVSGSGTTSLIFDYTVQPGDSDGNGISIGSNSLELNGGTLADAAGNAANLDHGSVGNDSAFIVDTTAPTLSSSTPDDEDTGFQVGDDIVLSFSEDVLADSGNIVISDGSDTRTIDITDGTQVSISGNDVTIDPTADLNPNSTYNVQIASGALTDLAGNAYAGISDSNTLNFDTEIVADTSIVVFDLTQNSSSSHSSRTFQSGVSYDIYIRVQSNDSALSLGGGDSWGGATNLGSDDRVILVGDGSAIQAPAGAVTQVAAGPTAVAWQSSASATGGLLQGSTFFRATAGGSDGVALFDSSFGGATLGATFSNTMPAGILTSQGLV